MSSFRRDINDLDRTRLEHRAAFPDEQWARFMRALSEQRRCDLWAAAFVVAAFAVVVIHALMEGLI